MIIGVVAVSRTAAVLVVSFALVGVVSSGLLDPALEDETSAAGLDDRRADALGSNAFEVPTTDLASTVRGGALAGRVEFDGKRNGTSRASAPTELDSADAVVSSADAAWAIVEELTGLAQAPRSFHVQAVPLIEQLGSMVESQASVAERRSDWALALVDEVAHDFGRSDLVRGAVWIGLVEAVDDVTHAQTFDNWLNGSDELARAALFAASRRAEGDICTTGVDYASILMADAPEEFEVPSVYPLAFVGRLVGPEEMSLELWLENGDPRRERILAGDPSAFVGSDGVELLDHLLTTELAFVLWGLGATESDRVAQQVVEQLQLDGIDPAESVAFIRAAAFLAHELAECSTPLFDAVIALDQSDENVHAVLGEHFRGQVEGPLSVAQIAHIERLKYTTDEHEEIELILALDRIEEQVRELHRASPLRQQETVDYLSLLAADALVPTTARALAVQAVANTGAWDSFRSCATQVMATGSNIELQAITITALYRHARADTARASSAIALLQGFRASNARPELFSSIDEYVRILSAS